MKYILLFLPAIAWGIMPLFVAGVKKSTTYNQITGTVIGAFVFGLVSMFVARPQMNWTVFCLAVLAGAAWTIGQVGQYISYANIGVSETMPLSTGLQLIGVPIVGVLLFGEWGSTQAKLFGFIGIIALIIGVWFTSKDDEGTDDGNKKNQTTTLIILVLTTLGYITSSSIPKAIEADSIAIFFGETVGMLIAAFIYLLASKQLVALKQKESYMVIPAGLVFAIGNLGYIFSVKENGVNLAFVMSQLSVIISTLSGIIFLHEHKSKKGYIYTGIGLVLIVAGAVLTSLF